MLTKKNQLKYKIVSIDLDGTLLTPFFHSIKKMDLIKICEYMKYGGLPFINTGRNICSSLKYIAKINKFSYYKIPFVSCFNGSWIKDFNDNMVYSSYLSNHIAMKLYQLAKKENVQIWFYKIQSNGKYLIKSNKLKLRFLVWLTQSIWLSKIKKDEDLSSYKIIFLSFNKKKIKRIYEILHNEKFDKLCTICLTDGRLIEITSLNISKSYALGLICQKYNIKTNELMVIGDSFNDKSSFEISKLAIGIKPKNKQLYQYCDVIIPHKKNGVATAINFYALPNKLKK